MGSDDRMVQQALRHETWEDCRHFATSVPTWSKDEHRQLPKVTQPVDSPRIPICRWNCQVGCPRIRLHRQKNYTRGSRFTVASGRRVSAWSLGKSWVGAWLSTAGPSSSLLRRCLSHSLQFFLVLYEAKNGFISKWFKKLKQCSNKIRL